jgi:hypothetical protein
MTQAFVTAQLTDGRELTADHDASLPERDIGKLTMRLIQKFKALAAPVLGDISADAASESIMHFGRLPDVGSVMRALSTA